ncbi:MAG: hypothetical protein Q9191_000586 [Dirinaria sp. TL-2023a]
MNCDTSDLEHSIFDSRELHLGYPSGFLEHELAAMTGLHDGNDIPKSLDTFELGNQEFPTLMDNPTEKIENPNQSGGKIPQEHEDAPPTSQDQLNPTGSDFGGDEHRNQASPAQVIQLQSNTENGHELSGDLLTHQGSGSNVYQYKGERQQASPVPQNTTRVGTPQGQRSRLLTMSSQGDVSSDEDRAHSMSSPDTSVASGRVLNRASSNPRGMEGILQQHNVSPHASRRHNPRYQPTNLRHEILSQEGSEFPSLETDHDVQSAYDQESVAMGHGTQLYHDLGRYDSLGNLYPLRSGYYGGKSQIHQSHGFVPAHGVAAARSALPHSPFMSGDSYQSAQHGSLDSATRVHGAHIGQAASHLLPYRGDPNVHLRYKEKGYGALKREAPSPELNFQSLREQHSGTYMADSPDNRTLADLEPDPIFRDEEDRLRLERIYYAMMEEDHAQDNEGMKRTWKALRKDRPKLQLVCRKVLNACYVSQNISTPLQHSVKPQHHYETLDDRVDAICEAFKQQKTMCKHLMEAPYLYQVVDDPNLAAMRVINNRKVNQGKKEAIEQGRKALAKAKAKKHVGQSLKSEMEDEAYNEYDDGEYEEDEGAWDEYGAAPYSSPAPAYPSAVKRTRQAPARQISSEDSADLTYRGPPAKRTKKSSKYQLNERNEMVDMSELEKERRGAQSVSRRAMQNHRSASGFQPRLRNDVYNSSTEIDNDSIAAGLSGFSDNGQDDEDYQPGRSGY